MTFRDERNKLPPTEIRVVFHTMKGRMFKDYSRYDRKVDALDLYARFLNPALPAISLRIIETQTK